MLAHRYGKQSVQDRKESKGRADRIPVSTPINEPQVRSEANDTIRVVVQGRGMNLDGAISEHPAISQEPSYHVGIMEDHIPRLICRNKPPALVLLTKMPRILTEHAIGHHILVERGLGLLF